MSACVPARLLRIASGRRSVGFSRSEIGNGAGRAPAHISTWRRAQARRAGAGGDNHVRHTRCLSNLPFRRSRVRGPASDAPPRAGAVPGTVRNAVCTCARAAGVRGVVVDALCATLGGIQGARLRVLKCRGGRLGTLADLARRWFVLVGSGRGRGGAGIRLHPPLRVTHSELPLHVARNTPLMMAQ